VFSATHGSQFTTTNCLFQKQALGPFKLRGIESQKHCACQAPLQQYPGQFALATPQVTMFNLDGSSADDMLLTGLFSAHNPTDGGFTNQVYGASGVYFDQDGICLLLLVLDMSMPQKSLFMSNPELAFTSILRGNKMVTSPWVSIFDKNYTRVPVPESNP
jgi:hypothetical protein